MSQHNFEKWSEMAKKAQEPFQAIAELNIKALQNISYLKPEDLTQIRNPEQLLEKQVSLAIENGQKALDYMQKSLQIFEQAMQSVVKESKKASEGILKESQKVAKGK